MRRSVVAVAEQLRRECLGEPGSRTFRRPPSITGDEERDVTVAERPKDVGCGGDGEARTKAAGLGDRLKDGRPVGVDFRLDQPPEVGAKGSTTAAGRGPSLPRAR